MLSRFFESLYLKVFVNIIVSKIDTLVYIEVCDNKGIADSAEETFKTTTLNDKMYQFIEAFTRETPYYYISILDTSLTQGVFPTCSSKNISQSVDMSEFKSMCYNNSWKYYTSKFDLTTTQKIYTKIGIDYIYSPFILLNNFFRDKIDSHMAMFVLIEDNAVSLSVFDNSELLYGSYLDMKHDSITEELMIDDMEDEEIDLEDDIDLDDIDALEEMDSLDDFGDIEDLDSLDEIDEFSDARDFEEELTEEAEEDTSMPINDADGFTDDYHRFSMIQSAVNEFYKDESVNSQFIETVYIADGVGVSGDFKTYLEEEMFLSVYIRHIDLAIQVCELAKMENS